MVKEDKIQKITQDIYDRQSKVVQLYRQLDKIKREIEGEKLVIQDLKERLN